MNTETTATYYPESSKAVIGAQLPGNAEARNGRFRPMLVITGMALCMGLSSCVTPYDSYSHIQTTTYSPGHRVNALPGGYRSEIISGTTYYYHGGYYYRPSTGGYIVVDAPRSSRYYADYGRRHQITQPSRRTGNQAYNRQNQRYEERRTLTRLPRGYREVTHRGTRYYQVGDRFYQRQNNSYVVVTRPY